MTSKILILKTTTGRKVWRNGRGDHTLKRDFVHGILAQSRPAIDSEENRIRVLEKAQKQIGKPLVWVDGGETPFFCI
jgi:hypothetical protein